MNSLSYFLIFFVLLIFGFLYYKNKQILLKRLIQSKKESEAEKMFEIAKKFIGKECLIYTFSTQLSGTILEVTDGAILMDNNNVTEAVNLDYIIRIREYPRKKNGKKKSIILD